MEQQWYYAVGNQQQGPVDAAAVRELIASGRMGPNDLVWKDGMADWVPASTIPELVVAPAVPGPGTDAGGIGQSPYQNQNTYTPGGTYVPPSPGLNYQPPAGEGGGLATASMVLGIISIPGACLACIGLICGILAVIFALQNKNPVFAGKAKVGLICGIIGIGLSILSSIIGVLINMRNL